MATKKSYSPKQKALIKRLYKESSLSEQQIKNGGYQRSVDTLIDRGIVQYKRKYRLTAKKGMKAARDLFPEMTKQTVRLRVEHPGVLELPKGAFKTWSEKKLADHALGLAKKKGKREIINAHTNLEVWNKNDDPKLSKKAKRVKVLMRKNAIWDRIQPGGGIVTKMQPRKQQKRKVAAGKRRKSVAKRKAAKKKYKSRKKVASRKRKVSKKRKKVGARKSAKKRKVSKKRKASKKRKSAKKRKKVGSRKRKASKKRKSAKKRKKVGTRKRKASKKRKSAKKRKKVGSRKRKKVGTRKRKASKKRKKVGTRKRKKVGTRKRKASKKRKKVGTRKRKKVGTRKRKKVGTRKRKKVGTRKRKKVGTRKRRTTRRKSR